MDSFENISDQDVITIMALDSETRIKVAENMVNHGGGFVKALGECFFRADVENRSKLAEAFINYVREYAPDKWKK